MSDNINGENCKFCCTKIDKICVNIGTSRILDNVSLHLHCGELTMLIGKNGAGKSTLVKSLLGEQEHTGKITFSSQHTGNTELTIGYVPQRLEVDSSPMSVYDLCCSATSKAPVFIVKNKKRYDEIKNHLKEFGADKLMDKQVSSLSGGELQRVLIGIATMPYPELLILDEPVSGIDAKGKKEFYKMIKKIKEMNDISVLLVSHDFDYIEDYADKVILLNKKVLKIGKPKEVLTSAEFVDEFKVGGITDAGNI